MSELYVYYRLSPEQAAAALAAFEAARGNAQVRLLQRDGGRAGADGLLTWMEIHQGAEAAISESRLAAALGRFVQGRRHIERFDPLAPPA